MKLSRSKIDLFIECPHCFHLDRVEGIKRPPGYPFTLNNAVDSLLKKEFDVHRANGTSHPLQAHLNLVPSNNPNMDQWRNSLRGGVGYHHPNHDCTYFGGIDDLWVDDQNIHYVVDYKATARANPEWNYPNGPTDTNDKPSFTNGCSARMAYRYPTQLTLSIAQEIHQPQILRERSPFTWK